MGDLQEALRALDEADTRAGLTAMQQGHGIQTGAATVGIDAIAVLCEAFKLDFEEVVVMANARGERIAELTLALSGVTPLCAAHKTVVDGIASGSLLTGLRLGLLIADLRHKRER